MAELWKYKKISSSVASNVFRKYATSFEAAAAPRARLTKNDETSIDFCNLGTKNEVANEPMIGAMQSDECIMNFFNPRADS